MSINMDEHLRLKKLRAKLNISQEELANMIGRKQGSISDIERGKNSVDGIVQLLKMALGANPQWLKKGEGPMLIEPGNRNLANQHTAQRHSGTGQGAAVPYYEMRSGRTSSAYSLFEEPPAYYVNFLPFNDCTAYVSHHGDSMYPRFLNGDILAIQQVNNYDVLLWGEAYLVLADERANNLRGVRLLVEHPNSQKVILRAVNPAYAGDVVLDKDSILSLHLVKGRITISV